MYASKLTTIELRFYAELNDFLLPSRRGKNLLMSFLSHPSVKDVVESLGIPHTEIDLIVVNGEPVTFDYQLQDKDRVAVYPVFEAFDISSITQLRAAPLREMAFILDVHLGKLARHMRMLGFNTLYRNNYQDEKIITLAGSNFIILTRDKGILKNSLITRGYFVRAVQPTKQLIEVIKRFDLVNKVAPFTRCMECNSLLQAVPKHEITQFLLKDTQQYYKDFFVCSRCGKIYWQGSHYIRMRKFIERIIDDSQQ